ncbi:hypothetical protein KQ298_01430 [Synechococcus sp. CS-1330]|nr:hypothetical protein [Synechococcus sp. CS-1330]
MTKSALESAMAHSNPSPPAGPVEEGDRLGNQSSMFNQLQRTRQWEADGTHLLRAAAFHAWAATGGAAPQ